MESYEADTTASRIMQRLAASWDSSYFEAAASFLRSAWATRATWGSAAAGVELIRKALGMCLLEIGFASGYTYHGMSGRSTEALGGNY